MNISQEDLDKTIHNLHVEYLMNYNSDNRKNILTAYENLTNAIFNIDWNNYAESSKSKYSTLISSLNHHLNRWIGNGIYKSNS
jgi:hypothetical protein